MARVADGSTPTKLVPPHSPEPLRGDPSEGIATDDFERCVSVLERILREPGILASLPEADRIRLMVAAGRVSRPSRLEMTKITKALRKETKARVRAEDRKARAATSIRKLRERKVFVAPKNKEPEENTPFLEELSQPKTCYVCKTEFRRLHFFYDSMCPECATLNYDKRFQSASLEGRTALITGARLKIGYQATLMMLRAGARVIATTRFPRDAAFRFAREEDFGTWGHRLSVFGLDLRHIPSVETLANYITVAFDRLDILINNAAQTVRRPPGFYRHLLATEEESFTDLPPSVAQLLLKQEDLRSYLGGTFKDVQAAARVSLGSGSYQKLLATGAGQLESRSSQGNPYMGLTSSAELSQVPWSFEEQAFMDGVFPEGDVDADLQQVDLRTTNSWRLTLAEVQSAEMIEVQLVNAIAPFVLCAKLKSLMERCPTGEQHIVNVSAMEGKFTRFTKTDKHPHTNMAKASLNMMTFTAAPDYIRSGIHMNAVDTGWVTDEDPAAHALRKRAEYDFQPPLDIVDGAARVCDPIFSGLITGVHHWGRFFKDYAPTSW